MKLHILSDLHIDAYIRRGLPAGDIPQTEADAVILAGDISNSGLGLIWAKAQAQALAKPVLYVTGNHEYFDENVLEFDQTLAGMAQHSGVVFLQKQAWQVADVRVLGCTLWTDFDFGTKPEHHTLAPYPLFDNWRSPEDAMTFAQNHMRDYVSIQCGERTLTPQDVKKIHNEQKQWLYGELKQAKADGVKAVVISHHSVSARSIAAKYAMSPVNGAFVSDFSGWMQSDFAPVLWVHGHTHDAFDYMLGKTRVVVNPRAYPNEISSTQTDFDWRKVVEV